MENFTYRMYGKTELALLYCPYLSGSAARRKLLQWIRMQPRLLTDLQDLGFSKDTRKFTPVQVRLIVGALGEP